MTILKQLVFLLLIVSVINCTLVCKDDGLYENTEDRTSYYECTDGKSYFRRCPKAEDGLSYLLFNGEKCVHSYPSFVCPQESGKYRFMTNSKQYYDCVESKPILKTCPEDTKFDGLECNKVNEPEPEHVQNDQPMAATNEPDNEVEFTCPHETGDYTNPDDKHSFYECRNSEPRLRLCPRERTVHLHGAHEKHRRRMIWDGHQCVQTHRLSDSRGSRQAPDIATDIMFNCPVPDGRFPDPRDARSFFQCINGEPSVEACPGDTIFNQAQSTCVHVPTVNELVDRGDTRVSCPTGTSYDSRTGRCLKEEYAEPIAHVVETQPITRQSCPPDTTFDPRTQKCSRVEYADPVSVPVVVEQTIPECPRDSTYDPNTGRCRRIEYVNPIAVVQPQPQPRRTCPSGFDWDTSGTRCVRTTVIDPDISTRCPGGYSWSWQTRRCESVQPVVPVGRYRRNGRVETEDRENGAVIVDTWNERQWRWDRNPNGDRILPDVNGWLDRSHAYNRRGGNPVYPSEEQREGYVRGRPAGYVYRN